MKMLRYTRLAQLKSTTFTSTSPFNPKVQHAVVKLAVARIDIRDVYSDSMHFREPTQRNERCFVECHLL